MFFKHHFLLYGRLLIISLMLLAVTIPPLIPPPRSASILPNNCHCTPKYCHCEHNCSFQASSTTALLISHAQSQQKINLISDVIRQHYVQSRNLRFSDSYFLTVIIRSTPPLERPPKDISVNTLS